MRDMQGLVDSLVSYIEQEERPEDKVMSTIMFLWFSEGVCICVMELLPGPQKHKNFSLLSRSGLYLSAISASSGHSEPSSPTETFLHSFSLMFTQSLKWTEKRDLDCNRYFLINKMS